LSSSPCPRPLSELSAERGAVVFLLKSTTISLVLDTFRRWWFIPGHSNKLPVHPLYTRPLQSSENIFRVVLEVSGEQGEHGRELLTQQQWLDGVESTGDPHIWCYDIFYDIRLSTLVFLRLASIKLVSEGRVAEM